MARVLWLSDGGSTTGFARVTHAIGDRLVTEYGHEVHCLAVNYDGDYWPTPMRMYRANARQGNDIFGQSRFVEMLAEVMPDVVVMLNDPYVILRFLLRNTWDQELVLARTTPFIAYMPVDGTNLPTTWSKLPAIINNLPPIPGGKGPNFVPVIMAEHGRTLYPDAELVYHGVDLDTYHPATPSRPIVTSTGVNVTSKAAAKKVFGIDPKSFLVLRVDRNSVRKNFGDTWKALVPVLKAHEDIEVWFHCKPEGDQLEVPQILSREMDLAERFHFPGGFNTKRGWQDSDLAALYNAADLFVSTSMGEGFGLTLAEAAACGVPIVAQNVASIPEVVGPGGLLIEPQRLHTVDSGQDQWLPDVPAFSEAIERLYSNRKLRNQLGAAGEAHVKRFSWPEAASRFNDMILRLAGGGSNA
jgi:glycosyltransferase involved in cell wall biosynthesis